MSLSVKTRLPYRLEMVFDALQAGPLTWDELRTRIKVNDEHLGLRLGELLDLRRIWTERRGDVRLYGVERRTGLAPRRIEEKL